MTGLRRILVIAAGVFVSIIAVLIVLFRGGGGGEWHVDVGQDPMTDVAYARARLPAENGQGGMELSCRREEPLRLIFRVPQRTGGFGEENYVQRMVRYRFDQGQVQETVGVLGDSFIGFDDTRRGVGWDARIIEGLRNASTLAVETETVRNGIVQLVFRVAGADAVIRTLRQRCELP